MLTCFHLTKGHATFFWSKTIVESLLHFMVLFFKVLLNHRTRIILNYFHESHILRTVLVLLQFCLLFEIKVEQRQAHMPSSLSKDLYLIIVTTDSNSQQCARDRGLHHCSFCAWIAIFFSKNNSLIISWKHSNYIWNYTRLINNAKIVLLNHT